MTFGGLQCRSWKSANCGNRIYSNLYLRLCVETFTILSSFISLCASVHQVAVSLSLCNTLVLFICHLFDCSQTCRRIKSKLYITIDVYNLHVLHLSRMVLMMVLINSNDFIFVFLEMFKGTKR